MGDDIPDMGQEELVDPRANTQAAFKHGQPDSHDGQWRNQSGLTAPLVFVSLKKLDMSQMADLF